MAALAIDLDRAARTPLATQIPLVAPGTPWNQGVKIWEVMKKIAVPMPGTPLHITASGTC
jgi:hypothetical protein